MAFRPATCARMSDMENFVADIVSAEKVPHTQGSLPLEVVVQSRKFPSTTSKHRKDPWTQSLLQLGLEVVVRSSCVDTTTSKPFKESLASKPVAAGSIGGVHTYALRGVPMHVAKCACFVLCTETYISLYNNCWYC